MYESQRKPIKETVMVREVVRYNLSSLGDINNGALIKTRVVPPHNVAVPLSWSVINCCVG